MTPEAIIIASLAALNVSLGIFIWIWRQQSIHWRAIAYERRDMLIEAQERIRSALRCATPRMANIGKRMARKLRGES